MNPRLAPALRACSRKSEAWRAQVAMLVAKHNSAGPAERSGGRGPSGEEGAREASSSESEEEVSSTSRGEG
eukprot:7816774-Alexandrium_andersonii.AAC.1